MWKKTFLILEVFIYFYKTHFLTWNFLFGIAFFEMYYVNVNFHTYMSKLKNLRNLMVKILNFNNKKMFNLAPLHLTHVVKDENFDFMYGNYILNGLDNVL